MSEQEAPQEKPVSTSDWYDYVANLTDLLPDMHPGGVEASNELLDFCSLSEDDVVLDVGCGSGATACSIAEQFGARVTGVDISEVMIDRAVKRAKKLGVSELVDFRVADVFQLPFDDDSFSVVLFQSVLMALEGDVNAAMGEMVRVLKDGGLIAGNEGTINEDTPDHYIKLLGKHPAIHRQFTSDTLRSLYEEAGLQVTELHENKYVDAKKSGRVNFIKFVVFMYSVYPRMLYKLLRDSGLREASGVDDRVNKQAKKYAGYTLIVGKKGLLQPV